MPVIVPELSVTDWRGSRAFYTGLLGFSVRYERPEEGFCYLEREGAELMLDQIGLGRDFDPGLTETPRPLGRGVNLQIEVGAIAPLLDALAGAGHPLILSAEDRWYRRDDEELGNRQFVVADPDGYALRFYEVLGVRKRR